MGIMIEVAPGELIDKITILEIKLEHMKDPNKRANVEYELELLTEACDSNIAYTDHIRALKAELKVANLVIWDVENAIRDHERAAAFGQDFIRLARTAYRTNDDRACIKRQLNELLNSRLLEEKSYS